MFFSHSRSASFLMDITFCFTLCLLMNSMVLALPSRRFKRQDVKLVPNSFQVIIQSSLPTSVPIGQKSSKYSYKTGDSLSSYQSDQGYVLPWPVEAKVPEEKERPSLNEMCKLPCKYGYEADIEGNELCKCKDPCEGVKCFGGKQCEPKKECIFDQCEVTAVCKGADDVCSLPKPKYTFMCEKLSKRYYFDTKKGLCRKFWGCAEIKGNSFDNKKACKNVCYDKEQKQRDRSERQHKKGSKEGSSQVSSELAEQEMSNLIPTYQNMPSIDNFISEDFEEKNNQVEPDHKKSSFSNLFSNHVPGLNQLSGCPKDNQYEPCPFDPCGGCTSGNVLCLTSFCGKCQAIYIDLLTGQASDKFAIHC
ncbi:uncharacterized protein [Watersipora subatra]|uniref:uncharacterized protein n=1 Tax=Watersipora subatra TaxID=2589382 RepID=UPI00355C55DB